MNTAIFKEPVKSAIRIRKLNVDGDRQADLTVHGGPDKAVYAYPAEHYEYWRTRIREIPRAWGAFGENLTTRNVLEKDLNIGDQVRVGTALLQVAQPRMPCYKLQVRFNREDMTKLFALSGRSGFYFSVIEEGDVKVGDAIEVVKHEEHKVSVADIYELYFGKTIDWELLKSFASACADRGIAIHAGQPDEHATSLRTRTARCESNQQTSVAIASTPGPSIWEAASRKVYSERGSDVCLIPRVFSLLSAPLEQIARPNAIFCI